MRKLLILAAAASLAGCASGGAPAVDQQRAILTTDEGTIRTSVMAGTTDTLAVPPDRAMRALLAAYQSLGIEVTLVDPPTRRLGNPQLIASRKLAASPLSEFLSCGNTFSGPRADNDRITMSIISTVQPSGSGSKVETRVDATALNVQSGNSNDRIACGSTGRLEARLHEAAKRAP